MALARWVSFTDVFFDCDGTLCAVEGIVELARWRGLEAEILALTEAAMAGVLPLEAVYAARLRRIQPSIVEAEQRLLGAYAQAIACRVHSTKETRLIVGALFAGEPRIVQVDDFPMEALPRGALLVMRSRDVPGVIGRVGTLLGEHGINIAEWRLGRDRPGGTALSFINLDHPAPPAVLEALRRMPEIEDVRQVLLDAGR